MSDEMDTVEEKIQFVRDVTPAKYLAALADFERCVEIFGWGHGATDGALGDLASSILSDGQDPRSWDAHPCVTPGREASAMTNFEFAFVWHGTADGWSRSVSTKTRADTWIRMLQIVCRNTHRRTEHAP